ncbi:hypothetical protein [Mycobacterium sp. shizuoka-1]|uniref:hypothetical protein n=1 Tax=Mycobacterium sp. shizuoka-1 TaxID=2039281 RepID=UPI000C05EB53|nr:hypothetical protein [Mycobacterium sp. shizuoka-1]GAY13761.1 hypothetical protein MSZK_04870 [Mycobacterium sp. shizuoka-1]
MTGIRFDNWYRPLATPLGLGPDRSDVTVSDGRVRVTMGWGFSADIPLAAITAATPARGPFLGWGVHGWRGRWLVNGSSKGVVELAIDPPVQAKVVGVPTTLRTLLVSVTDPEALIAACGRN